MKSLGSNVTIVFICEHGAAKSVLAATYFNQFASELGLSLRAVARGTNPDRSLSSQVINGLTKNGLAPIESFPKKLTEADMESAKRVVTFCELPGMYQQFANIEYWEDIPPVSEDYDRSRDIITERIRLLLNSMG
jgi:arsenate reductase